MVTNLVFENPIIDMPVGECGDNDCRASSALADLIAANPYSFMDEDGDRFTRCRGLLFDREGGAIALDASDLLRRPTVRDRIQVSVDAGEDICGGGYLGSFVRAGAGTEEE